MKEQLEQLSKMVNDLREEIKKGTSPERMAELVRPEIEKAFAATRHPDRRGQFDAGGSAALAGRDLNSIIYGVTPKYVRPGGWTQPQVTNRVFTPDVEELHKLNDYKVIAACMLAGKSGRRFELQTEQDVQSLVKELVVGNKAFDPWKEQESQLAKALDSTTAAEGLEFVPTGFSRDLIDRVRIAAQVAALFTEIQMPTDPFKLPARAFARTNAVSLSESTADAATKITAKTPGTRNVTLDAKKLGMRILWSLELEEDSIIAMAPMLREELIEGLAYGIETADINGDTTAPHQDNDTNGGAADLAEKTWIGLRKHAQANTLTEDLSTFNTAGLRLLRNDLGKYGARPMDLAWIVSVKVLVTKLLGLAEVITIDKYGPLATVVTGELARFDGIPIIVSEHMRDDVAATGVNTVAGPNTKSNMVIVNRKAWVHGVRRGPTLKTKEDIETDQMILVGTWRGDFQRVLGTAETHTAQGINI